VLYYYHLSETNDVAVRKKPDAALPQSVTIPIKWALSKTVCQKWKYTKTGLN